MGARTRDGEDSLDTASTMSLLDRICMYAHTRATRSLRVEGEIHKSQRKPRDLTDLVPRSEPYFQPDPHRSQLHLFLIYHIIAFRKLINGCLRSIRLM